MLSCDTSDLRCFLETLINLRLCDRDNDLPHLYWIKPNCGLLSTISVLINLYPVLCRSSYAYWPLWLWPMPRSEACSPLTTVVEAVGAGSPVEEVVAGSLVGEDGPAVAVGTLLAMEEDTGVDSEVDTEVDSEVDMEEVMDTANSKS